MQQLQNGLKDKMTEMLRSFTDRIEALAFVVDSNRNKLTDSSPEDFSTVPLVARSPLFNLGAEVIGIKDSLECSK